ncbi:hypothetical protein BDW02DRAFT_136345 [Decorospora gaudefroyi]|uniref:Uncharacterized protein n=1 Tax=Decorospora gaudefroyi TaxID=184978 RepID=A0A6A5JXU3_9PLEO|nr:hypothetical protein BDW02DRAFT_136345 [Decorospora gaudefroyi]
MSQIFCSLVAHFGDRPEYWLNLAVPYHAPCRGIHLLRDQTVLHDSMETDIDADLSSDHAKHSVGRARGAMWAQSDRASNCQVSTTITNLTILRLPTVTLAWRSALSAIGDHAIPHWVNHLQPLHATGSSTSPDPCDASLLCSPVTSISFPSVLTRYCFQHATRN